MADPQLALFGAAPAPAPPAPEPCAECNPFGDDQPCTCDACAHHNGAYICPACATCGDTDGCGFLHRQVCKGRIPLRACRGCGKLRTHGTWNHADYFHCTTCVPLGSKKDHAAA